MSTLWVKHNIWWGLFKILVWGYLGKTDVSLELLEVLKNNFGSQFKEKHFYVTSISCDNVYMMAKS